MPICTKPTYQNSELCPTSEFLSAVNRVWYANREDWEAAKVSLEISATGNLIDVFAPTTPILYPLWTGKKFDIAPNSVSFKTPAGSDKWKHSIILQLIGASVEDDAEASKLIGSNLVIIYEVKGANATNDPDSFKVIGYESGLTAPDGGVVLNANENGGATIASLASDTEDGDVESFNRMTLKPTAAITKALVLAAIELAEVAPA